MRADNAPGGAAAAVRSEDRLFDLMGIGPHELVSVTGAGGKTSLIYHLAHELSLSKRRVVVTTTTKMQFPMDYDGDVIIDGDAARAILMIESGGSRSVYAGSCVNDQGKVVGYPPDAVDALYLLSRDIVFLNEADGAKMKPYTFWRTNEPVIPVRTTLVAHVISAEILGRTMGDALFHRCPAELVGRVFDERMLRESVEWFAKMKLAEFDCRKTLVINKAEGAEREAAGTRIAETVGDLFDDCLITSLANGTWKRWMRWA